MSLYCLNCRKSTGSKNQKVVKAKNRSIMFLWKCEVCDSKKLKHIKEQEASGLSSSLGRNTLFTEISFVGPLLF